MNSIIDKKSFTDGMRDESLNKNSRPSLIVIPKADEVMKEAKKIGKLELVAGMISSGEDVSIEFSHGDKHYFVAKNKCKGCNDIDVRMWIISNRKGSEELVVINNLRGMYKSNLISI